MLKVGIIGCGTIGSELAAAIERRFARQAQLAYLCDINQSQLMHASSLAKSRPQIAGMDELIRNSDLVIEAASAKIALSVAEEALKHNKLVLIMSVGGLIQSKSLFDMIKRSRGKLYVPSGAVCGIDGLKAAQCGHIHRVTLTTRKPPAGLQGVPYLIRRKIDVDRIKKETVVFEGNVKDAVEAFPQNINVSAVLSLAGVGPFQTRVRMVCDPALKRNVHEVQIEGDFGKITTQTENVPSAANPKTSQLAIFSAIATLDRIFQNFQLGT